MNLQCWLTDVRSCVHSGRANILDLIVLAFFDMAVLLLFLQPPPNQFTVGLLLLTQSNLLFRLLITIKYKKQNAYSTFTLAVIFAFSISSGEIVSTAAESVGLLFLFISYIMVLVIKVFKNETPQDLMCFIIYFFFFRRGSYKSN